MHIYSHGTLTIWSICIVKAFLSNYSNLIIMPEWPGRLDVLIFTTVIFGNIYYVVWTKAV